MPKIRVIDFARSPGGRFKADGPFSGQEYRDEVLVPALQAAVLKNETLDVELDGASGYGSSFLEEAFGGLVRLQRFRPAEIRRHLKVTAITKLYSPYATLANKYIEAAEKHLMVA